MNISSKFLLAFASAALLGVAAHAQTTVSAGPGTFNSGPGQGLSGAVATVDLGSALPTVDVLTGSFSVADQGWGGAGLEDVRLIAQVDGVTLWSDTLANDAHGSDTFGPPYQFYYHSYDLTGTSLDALNAALAGKSGDVTISLYADAAGYPGWEEHVTGGTLSATYSAPDTGSTIALLGGSLLALAAASRKKLLA